MQEALWHYEFNQFEVDEAGTISAKDFAHSLLAYLTYNNAMTYFKRIKKLDFEGWVAYPEFVAFNWFMNYADMIKMKIVTYRVLQKQDLRKLADDFSS